MQQWLRPQSLSQSHTSVAGLIVGQPQFFGERAFISNSPAMIKANFSANFP